jgi:hypothetical protein
MQKVVFLSIISLLLFFCISCKNDKEKSVLITQKPSTNENTSIKEYNEVPVNSQTTSLSLVDNYPLLQLSVFIPNNTLSASAQKLLETRLNQQLTKNGLGGFAINSRFVLIPTIVELSKNITTTAPTMYVINYEITFFVGDIQTNTLFSSYSTQFKGVGETESEAFKIGFNNLNLKDNDAFTTSFTKGKEKIIEFYNKNCEYILKQAMLLDRQGKYEEAIMEITTIPPYCGDCTDKAIKIVEPIYTKIIDRDCKQKLSQMKSELISYNIEQALVYYIEIPKNAKCFGEAEQLVNYQIKQLKPEEKKKWDFEMQKYSDDVAYRNKKMETIQQISNNFINNFSTVGVAQAKYAADTEKAKRKMFWEQ